MENLEEIWKIFLARWYYFWYGRFYPAPNQFNFQKLFNILFLFGFLIAFSHSHKSVQIESVSNVEDWMLIKSMQGEWVVLDGEGGSTDDHCLYEIFYSESRNDFKFEYSGLQPKNHKMYEDVAILISDVNEAMILDKNKITIINLIKERTVEE